MVIYPGVCMYFSVHSFHQLLSNEANTSRFLLLESDQFMIIKAYPPAQTVLLSTYLEKEHN